jgi:hypothetical protein
MDGKSESEQTKVIDNPVSAAKARSQLRMRGVSSANVWRISGQDVVDTAGDSAVAFDQQI